MPCTKRSSTGSERVRTREAWTAYFAMRVSLQRDLGTGGAPARGGDARLMMSKLMPGLEEELGADLARSQAESFVAHLEQSGFFIMRRPIPNHAAGDNPVWRGFKG